MLLAAFAALPVLAQGPAADEAEYASETGISAPELAALSQIFAAADRQNWTILASYSATLKDPVAQSLARWIYYTHADKPERFEDIVAFIRKNSHWPRMKLLAAQAEKSLRPDLSDDVLVSWFRSNPPQSAKAMAAFLGALDRVGAKKEIATSINKWWARASLTAEEQAAFLDSYGKIITRDNSSIRLTRLLDTDQYTAARALARRLGGGYPDLAEARIALSSGKGGVDHYLSRIPAELQDDPGLMLERLRWRLRNDKDFAAIEIFHKMPPAAKIPNIDSWWKSREILTRRLMAQRQYDSAYYLVAAHGTPPGGSSFAEAEFMAGWLALRYVNKPWEAFQHFERLYQNVQTPISRSRAAFWAGKASDALKYPDVARQWYVAAARHQTSFYGQMAINMLPEKLRPAAPSAPNVTLAGQQQFDKIDLVRAVKILARSGMRDETADFISALSEHVKEPQDYRLLAQLAESLGYYHSAVRVAKKALNTGVLLGDQLYPTMLAQMKRVDVEWALVHGVIRQESIFDPRALSPVGALGLMQVMPDTGRHVARKNGFQWSGPGQLYDPAVNIKFGSAYLREMLEKYDGSYAMALAAYNAGPSRVDRWLRENGDPRREDVALVDWIESIPFSETRNYVQRILESVYIYRLKFKDLQSQVQGSIHTAAGNGI